VLCGKFVFVALVAYSYEIVAAARVRAAGDRRRRGETADTPPPASGRENGRSSSSASTASCCIACASHRARTAVEERGVELAQPVEQRIARVAANRLRLRAGRVELADDRVDRRIERSILAGAQRREPRNDALEMRGKTASRAARAIRAARAVFTARGADTHRPASGARRVLRGRRAGRLRRVAPGGGCQRSGSEDSSGGADGSSARLAVFPRISSASLRGSRRCAPARIDRSMRRSTRSSASSTRPARRRRRFAATRAMRCSTGCASSTPRSSTPCAPGATAQAMQQLAVEADEELRPFRARMPAEAYQQSHRACVDRLLRERPRGCPRFRTNSHEGHEDEFATKHAKILWPQRTTKKISMIFLCDSSCSKP